MLPVDHEITSSTGGGQLFAKHRGWGSLANELRVHILQELDVTDLLSCSKVARVFKTLIDDTPSLRYRLLLHAAGMRDGPGGGLSVLKRIALLEDYENSWKAGNISIRQRPSWDYYEAGGLFMTLDRDQCQLDIRRPASFFSGVPETAWTMNLSELPEQGHAVFDPSSRYAVDLAQDLLVLMELPVHEPEKYPKCYVLSLSGNGATHPLAARGEIYLGSSLGLSSPKADVEIVGDLVGCTVLGMDVYMSVYNWKTGTALWYDSEWDGNFNEMVYHTRCHILDSAHVLKISKYDLTMYPMAANFGTSTTGELAWNLGMPALAEGFKATYRASYIQRPRETPDCSPHFECDPSVTVLVVKYDLHHESRRRQDRTVLIAVIPISTMLARARVPPTTPKIPWEDWGALGARLVLMPSQTSYYEYEDIDVFGSRVVVSVPLRLSQQRVLQLKLAVFDVREGVVHAEGSTSTAECETTSTFLILDRFTEEDTPVFARPVEAKMPYRMVKTCCEVESRDISFLCDGLCAWQLATSRAVG